MSEDTRLQQKKQRKKPIITMKINLQKAQQIRDMSLNSTMDDLRPPSLRINRLEMSKIEEWLYLSGETTAADPEILEVCFMLVITEINHSINDLARGIMNNTHIIEVRN